MPQRTEMVGDRPARFWERVPLNNRPEVPPFPAEVALMRQGFEVFVPTERYKRSNRFAKRGGRRNPAKLPHNQIGMMRPMIPGFALVWVDEEGFNWLRLMTIPYVLGMYGAIRGVNDNDIRQIAAMEARIWTPNPYGLIEGDTARVSAGALKGKDVTVTKVVVDAPQAMLQGLVNLFGSEVEIEVPLDMVKGTR